MYLYKFGLLILVISNKHEILFMICDLFNFYTQQSDEDKEDESHGHSFSVPKWMMAKEESRELVTLLAKDVIVPNDISDKSTVVKWKDIIGLEV